MQKSKGRKGDALILPGVLLTVALLEDIVTYKVRQHVRDVYLRAAIVVALNGVAFTVGAELVGPWIRRFLATARRDSKRRAGPVGLILFYGLSYGALYWAYLVDQVHGPAWLLPLSLR